MFTDFHLVGWFVQLFEVTPCLAVVIGIITQVPVGIEVEVIAKTAIKTQLQAVKTDRIPKSPDSGIQKKAGSAEGQRKGVACGQLLVFGGQVAVEPDDIAVITGGGAHKKQERPGFEQGGIQSGPEFKRG